MGKKKKSILIIVCEGETEEEFYKKALSVVRKVCDCKRFSIDEIKYICADGVGNISSKAVAKIRFEVIENPKYIDSEKTVCLCYDKDVLEIFKRNPPLNPEKVRQSLELLGVGQVIEIVADKMIEDWFVEDLDGIVDYLCLGKKYKTPKGLKGINLLMKMFKDASKVYIKGSLVRGFVEKLNVAKILSNHCKVLKALCDVLGVNCSGNACIAASINKTK